MNSNLKELNINIKGSVILQIFGWLNKGPDILQISCYLSLPTYIYPLYNEINHHLMTVYVINMEGKESSKEAIEYKIEIKDEKVG